MCANKRGGLGRGLDSLFMDAVPIEEDNREENLTGKIDIINHKPLDRKESNNREYVERINIHSIFPNVNQPRKTFDADKITELANSILENGIIQPIVVRTKENGYEIVAGERRWRAAMEAGLTKIPAIIRELDDQQNMLFAIIENMQREDLNPIEEAQGISQMIDVFFMTQEEVSKSLGKSRPYITNSLRLLKLPEYVKEAMSKGEITAGHGRTLITIENEDSRREALKKVIKEGLSVRETEKLVKSLSSIKKRPAKKKKNPEILTVENELKEILGTRISIKKTGNKGKIEIDFFSKDELDRLIDLLRNSN